MLSTSLTCGSLTMSMESIPSVIQEQDVSPRVSASRTSDLFDRVYPLCRSGTLYVPHISDLRTDIYERVYPFCGSGIFYVIS